MSAVTKGPRRVSLKVLAAAFVVACLLGGAGYMYMQQASRVPDDKLVRIDNMISNLSQGGMVKISVSVLMVPSPEEEKTEDAIRDALIGYLRTVNKDDLDGSAGLDFLRSSLVGAAKQAVGQDKVKEVLIREFVVQ